MSVCFTAIVKNEAKVIARCIDSTRGVVDRYRIVDTGSTDGTQELIRAHMKKLGVKGELIQSDWKGFGESRTEAAWHARKSGADYSLMMDADHLLKVERWPKLGADLYQVPHHFNGMIYCLPILQHNRIKWRYEMPVHEYLCGDRPHNKANLDGAYVVVTSDGHRSQNPKKFEVDAEVLLKYCLEHPDDPRAHYYLAQSYRDAAVMSGDKTWWLKAKAAYLHRASMNGWVEENWSALYEAAKAQHMLDEPDVVSAYLRAYQARPSRAEPLVHAAAYCRAKHQFALGLMFAKQAAEIAPTTDMLFVEAQSYSWRRYDELAVAAWQMGQFEIGHRAAQMALACPDLPPGDRPRCEANVRFFEQKAA